MTRSSWTRILPAVVACFVGTTMPAGASPVPSGPARPLAIQRQVAADNLNFPAAFTFAPDGRIFYGERLTGEIRIFDPSDQSDTLFFDIPKLHTDNEQGLLGLALHPDYATTKPFVFAYVSRLLGGVQKNQIVRIRDDGGTGSRMKVIYSGDVPAASIHNGGHIGFGPDRMLYAVAGERGNPANSQNLGNDAGKVLRMTDTGAVPADNPFAGSRIWSYGLRNSFGFTFDPENGHLWETENGPECNDELNLIIKGKNYGWGPHETCSTPPSPPNNTNQDGPTPKLPKRFYSPTIAPTGAVFCQGCGLSASEGTYFYGTYNPNQIRRVTLAADRSQIASVATVFTNPGDGILSMERGPDGTVYFSDTGAIYKLVEA